MFEDGFDSRGITRGEVLKLAGAGAGGILLSNGLAGVALGASNGGTINIGVVSPLTGPAAGFGEPDRYVIGLARKALAKGITSGGKTYKVNIIEKDSQSNPGQAAKVAGDLINKSKVDLVLATSTPESVNPVADAAEAAGVPYITTVVPWEAWYFGRGAKDPTKSPFRFGFHFSFGVENFANAYEHLWPQVKTNKKVGVMWPNDADGNAIRAALGPLLKKAGYEIVDPGAYQDGTNDYSAQISKFKSAGVQIFNTFPIPPDFATFWKQAAKQGLTKQIKIAQIAKTGLFPSQVTALGSLGNGLASGVYWHPTWPYKSSLTGITSKQLASGYEKASGKQWNQQAGATLALFDVAAAALKASGNPKNKQAIVNAMKKAKVMTPMGQLDWSKKRPGVPSNVVPTPIIGGQWRPVKNKFKVDFFIAENSNDHKVPVATKLKPY
ncbi:MAG TPA: ABC transporter substrate-binding protein [Polyangia bacterium]|nr:ABC transporter substrate-binding protein [Polyangia bacterium]